SQYSILTSHISRLISHISKMSNSIYIEYNFRVSPLQPASDILIAELGEVQFESFVETEEGVQAYIKKEDWNPDILQDLPILQNTLFRIDFDHTEIEQENWNATWEQNFNPIQVGDRCVVRAPFRSEEHTSELQSRENLVCRLLLEK